MGLGNKPWIKLWLLLLVIIVFVLFRKFNKKTVEGFVQPYYISAYPTGLSGAAPGQFIEPKYVINPTPSANTFWNPSRLASGDYSIIFEIPVNNGVSAATIYTAVVGDTAHTPTTVYLDFINSTSRIPYGTSPATYSSSTYTNSSGYNTFRFTNMAYTGYYKYLQVTYYNREYQVYIRTHDFTYVRKCTAGSYLNTIGSCSQCPAGKSSVAGSVGINSCIDCPLGSYNTSPGSLCTECTKVTGAVTMKTDSVGSTSSATCAVSSCQEGYYKNGNQCTQCSAGSFSSAGALSCSTCPINTYSGVGASNCTNCLLPNATQTTSPNGSTSLSACKATSCLPGYYVNNGACTACAAGSFSAGGTASNCTLCTVGTYSTGTATSCTSCGANKYTKSNGATSSSSCLTLPTNSYLNSTSNGFICREGYFNNLNAFCSVLFASAIANPSGIGYLCKPGYSQSTTGCTICTAGNYSATAGSTSCTQCGLGTYSSSNGASNCLLPTSNTVVNSGRSGLQCPSGTIYESPTSCRLCGVGTYNTGVNLSSCTACGPGKYTNSNGATHQAFCLSLPSNASQNSTGGFICNPGFYRTGTTCTSLPSNAVVNANGTGYTCRPGFYNNGAACVALPSNATLNAAGTGFVCGAGFSQSTSACVQCGVGFYSAAGASSCTACGPGTYSSMPGASNCITPPTNGIVNSNRSGFICSSNYYRNGTECVSLPSNAVANSAGTGFTCSVGFSQSASGCIQCGIGTYNETAGATSCTACGANKYTTSNGATSASSCLSLPSNAVLNSNGSGYVCGPGYYGNGTECLSPPENSVMNSSGTGYVCNPGYYRTGSSCLLLPSNAAVNNDGTGYVCSTGYYRNGTECISLPSNATTNSSGLGFTCAAGFSQSETGCIQCLAGTYNSIPGESSCSNCSPGTYSGPGASSCISAPSNAVANSSGTGFICNSNYYNGGTSCVSMPSNATVNSNGTGFVCDLGYSQGLTSCVSCGVGTYNSVAGSSNCTTCEMSAGASAMTSPQASVGQSNCMATSCLPGHGFASGNCTQCGAGFFGSGGTTTCIACSQPGYTTPLGSSNASACYCPNTNLPPKAKGSAARLLSALNTCIPDGTNVYNFTIGTSVTTTNPCTGQSFYDFDKQACVNYLGEVISAGSVTVCDSNSAYSQETNACVPVRTIVKPNDPQLNGTTDQPGPGDYNNCKTVDQGDCTLLFKGTNGAYTTTNPCLANGTKYSFATKSCSSARNPCCSITNPAQAASRGCSSSVENVFTKNPAKCPPNSKTLCCNQAQSTNFTCQNNGFWKNTLQFKQSHRTACALTSPFTNYGDNSKIDTIADKREKRLIRISA